MALKPSAAALTCFLIGSFADHVAGEVIFEDLHLVPKLVKAHGWMMGITFVIVFPLGAVLIRFARFKGAVWVHAALQLVGWVLMIAGLAMGIRMAKILDYLHNTGHTIFGTIIVAAMLLQPFIGYIHHLRFRKTQGPTAWTHLHVWYGRVLILCGMINGGLGLKLASKLLDNRKGTIAYGTVAGVVGVAYLLIVGGFEWKKTREGKEATVGQETEERAKQTA